jgi:shikimate kinase
MKNIILIGMPGSGKSTVGVVLAKILGMDFADVDLVIQQREGALLQDILDRLGNEQFLELEADVICSLNCQNTVISPGGSAVLVERGAAHLKELGTVVYLDVPCSELEVRLSNLASRGVTLAPGQTIADLFAYRKPFYEKCADLTIDTQNKTLEETCAAILQALINQ